jgi:glycosyltransferase involved in cell wall biosynthesis
MAALKPKLICFFVSNAFFGGAERSLLDLARGLKKRPELGFVPWVLIPREGTLMHEELKAAGIDHDVLPIPRSFYKMTREAPLSAFQLGLRAIPGMGFYLTKLILLLRKKKPALIQSVGLKAHALAAIVGPPSGIPVVWFLNELFDEGPSLWTLRTLQRASQIHAVAASRAIAESFAAHDARVPVVHAGVDPETFVPRPNRIFNRMMGLGDEVPVVGMVGSLLKAKGQMEFLRMAERLARQGSPARFVLVGGELPAERDERQARVFVKELRHWVASSGLQTSILFAGFRKDPAEALNGLDVLVHAPTEAEGFSRVLVEAMGCGVPVVAVASGGAGEVVTDGRTGLIFQSIERRRPSDDSIAAGQKPAEPVLEPIQVEKLAASVQSLLGDPALRARLGEQARHDFGERWVERIFAHSFARIYSSLTDRGA